MESKLKVGKVRQKFGNSELSKIYSIKSLPINTGDSYWSKRTHLYNLDGSISHVAHIDTLQNVEEDGKDTKKS